MVMYPPHVDKILSLLDPEDKVLDIGGWAKPFNRADWVLDIQAYDSRGTFGSEGPGPERFKRETWLVRDICDRTPFPFPDKFFDYVICSHTLEDVRDPLFVCAEMTRIGRRGYVETPSSQNEVSLGVENQRYAGRCHHRWLVDIVGNEIIVTFKFHHIHSNWKYHLPPIQRQGTTALGDIAFLFWEDRFDYREEVLFSSEDIDEKLTRLVRERGAYPQRRYVLANWRQWLLHRVRQSSR